MFYLKEQTNLIFWLREPVQSSLYHSTVKSKTVSGMNLSATLCFQTPPGSWGHLLVSNAALSAGMLLKITCLPKITLKSLLPSCQAPAITWLISHCKLCCCQGSVGGRKQRCAKRTFWLYVTSLWHSAPLPVSSQELIWGGKLSAGWQICTVPRWTIFYFFSIPGWIFLLKD